MKLLIRTLVVLSLIPTLSWAASFTNYPSTTNRAPTDKFMHWDGSQLRLETRGELLTNRPWVNVLDFSTFQSSSFTTTNYTAPNGSFWQTLASTPTNGAWVTNGALTADFLRGYTNGGTAALHFHGTNSDGGNFEFAFMEISSVRNSAPQGSSHSGPVFLLSTNPIYVGGSSQVDLTGVFHIIMNDAEMSGIICTQSLVASTNLSAAIPLTNVFSKWYYDGTRHQLGFEFLGNNRLRLFVDNVSLVVTNPRVEDYRPQAGRKVYFGFEIAGYTNSDNQVFIHKLGYGNRSFLEASSATRSLRLNETPEIASVTASNWVLFGDRTGIVIGSTNGFQGYRWMWSNSVERLSVDEWGRVVVNRFVANRLGRTVDQDAGLEVWAPYGVPGGTEAFNSAIKIRGLAAGFPASISFKIADVEHWRVGTLYNTDMAGSFNLYNIQTGATNWQAWGNGSGLNTNLFGAHLAPFYGGLYTLGTPASPWPVSYLGLAAVTNLTLATNGTQGPVLKAQGNMVRFTNESAGASASIHAGTIISGSTITAVNGAGFDSNGGVVGNYLSMSSGLLRPRAGTTNVIVASSASGTVPNGNLMLSNLITSVVVFTNNAALAATISANQATWAANIGAGNKMNVVSNGIEYVYYTTDGSTLTTVKAY